MVTVGLNNNTEYARPLMDFMPADDGIFGGGGGGLGGVLSGLFPATGSGSGGGSGLGGALSGALSGAAVGGPWGAAIGAAGSFLSGILGDITMEGWSISCIGKQAFNKQDFEREMSGLEQRKNAVNGSNLKQVSDFLTDCAARVETSRLEIGRYKSSCSKALNEKFVDALLAVTAEVLQYYSVTTVQSETKTDWKGGKYSHKVYTVTGMKGGAMPSGGGSQVPVPSPGSGVIPGGDLPGLGTGFNPGGYYDPVQGIANAYDQLPLPDQVLLSTYASQNGIALNDLLTAFFSGQVQIKDGRVIWGVSAGNQNAGGVGDLVMYGLIGLIAYKFFIKK